MKNSGSRPLVLAALLSPAAIKLNLTADRRDTVLEELVALIPALAGQPAARQALLRALIEREQLHSTGIGCGIALPHSRNTIAGILDRPLIVVGRHAKGIPYAAVDNAPARLFFLLVATTLTEHLAILARISRLLRGAALRDALLAADRPEQVIALVREAEAQM